MRYHNEIIRCPECNKLQKATIEHSIPFWTYIHNCSCGNIIMESDWNEEPVKDDMMGVYINILI